MAVGLAFMMRSDEPSSLSSSFAFAYAFIAIYHNRYTLDLLFWKQEHSIESDIIDRGMRYYFYSPILEFLIDDFQSIAEQI